MALVENILPIFLNVQNRPRVGADRRPFGFGGRLGF